MPKEKVYDGELLFKAWCGWGAAATNPKLMEFARATYGQTSQMGPNYSMWNWAFNNPEKAFEMYKEWWFDTHPDKDPIDFQDFLKILQEKGVNKNVGGSRRNLERFCAKYGLEMDFNVKPDDVIQVTRPDHTLFQKVLIVERVDGPQVEAFIWNPDGTRSNHQLSVREFGVVGSTIV